MAGSRAGAGSNIKYQKVGGAQRIEGWVLSKE